MKNVTLIVAGGLVLSMMVLAGLAAGDGAGVCAAGMGGDVTSGTNVTNAYVGVNVGQNSETGVYDNQAAFQTQCCAETGQPPDCFAPVQ